MPYQYLPDTWGAAVVVTVVTLDRIIPGPGFDVFLSEGSQWNTAIGLRTTNARTARFYYDLVYCLLFSCLGFPEDLRKTNAAKVRRKLEIRWRENAKHSHTSVLKQEKCDKAPWLMSGTPFVESTRLQQPWKWIKWIKWISQLLNPQKNAWGCGTQLHRVWSRMNGLDS
jgi:hypothetical protein